jgi:hypothetical protein
MSLLLAAIVLALVAAAWVVSPLLFNRWGPLGDITAADVIDREARKRVALAALKDVEYDKAAGKLDEDDYLEMRGKLESEALDAVRAAGRQEAAGIEVTATHACGFTNPTGSRFCAGCGQRLT